MIAVILTPLIVTILVLSESFELIIFRVFVFAVIPTVAYLMFSKWRKGRHKLFWKKSKEINLFDEFCHYLNELRSDFGESPSIQDSITDIYDFIQRYKKFYVLAEKRSADTANLSRRFEKEKSMITFEIELIKNNISNFMLDRELYGFQLSSGKVSKVIMTKWQLDFLN